LAVLLTVILQSPVDWTDHSPALLTHCTIFQEQSEILVEILICSVVIIELFI
jgi:hypothetical protein